MGMKASFMPKGDMDKYLVCNADESEPGTFKDRELMFKNPHALIEGMVIAAYAAGANKAFIFIRGEYETQAKILDAAVAEAYEKGYLGTGIFGSGFDLELVVHRGQGAYICGEETALLDSLEGYRGQPRLRPPFPATHGLYGCPTVINNVETIASVPHIVLGGVEWWRTMGTEKSPGPKIFSVSGHVRRPGQYEVPLGTTARELIMDLAGGLPDGRSLKAWTPGGSSTPMLTAEHLDTKLDFEGVGEAGSLLGTAAIMVMDDTVCLVRTALRLTQFYAHESCGKCTPCREGTYWMTQILDRLERGQGSADDITTLLDTCDNIFGRSFCALGDGATSPIVSSIKYFRDEYVAHYERGSCPLPAKTATLAGAH
jgi:NADH-quinone oxidoreductase subunit F